MSFIDAPRGRCAVEQRLLDLLGEQALAAGFRQRTGRRSPEVRIGMIAIASGAARSAMRVGETALHFMGLGERERAPPRRDVELDGQIRCMLSAFRVPAE